MAEVVVKKGEELLRTDVGRSVRGLVIRAKAHPSIEQWFQEKTSGNDPIPISNYKRLWTPMPEYPELIVYQPLPRGLSGVHPLHSGGYYTISAPGAAMLVEQEGAIGGAGTAVNLSFLRLRGISENLGIAFSIKGTYEEKEVRDIAEKVQRAMKRFYIDHMRPVGVTIQLITSEATYV